MWATAFCAGLRRGELRGLRWEDVDPGKGVLHIHRGWDDHEGEVAPKGNAGRRTVPIVAELRTHLAAHRLRSGRAEGFVFGRSGTDPFTPSNVRKRAETAWKGVAPIGLHEARHTFASVLIAAGVNVKAISTYMGHSSVTIPLDRYGHLMPGHEAEAVEKIDTYLAGAAAWRALHGNGFVAPNALSLQNRGLQVRVLSPLYRFSYRLCPRSDSSEPSRLEK